MLDDIDIAERMIRWHNAPNGAEEFAYAMARANTVCGTPIGGQMFYLRTFADTGRASREYAYLAREWALDIARAASPKLKDAAWMPCIARDGLALAIWGKDCGVPTLEQRAEQFGARLPTLSVRRKMVLGDACYEIDAWLFALAQP